MFKQNMIIQDKETDNAGGGTPTEQTPSSSGYQAPPAAPKEEGDKFDQFGYEKPAAKAAAAKETPAEPPKAKEPEKLEDVKDPATGYGIKAPEVPKETPAEPPKDTVTPPVEELIIDTKGLDDQEAAKIKDFAKANSLTKEVAQKFVELKKSEIELSNQSRVAQQKQQERAVLETRANWHKELQTDSYFGGDKFDKNVLKVEKVIADFMPGTKKALTDSKFMLSPSVMKDLAKLADHLYNPENFVQGESGLAPVEIKEDSKNNPLDFYT